MKERERESEGGEAAREAAGSGLLEFGEVRGCFRHRPGLREVSPGVCLGAGG